MNGHLYTYTGLRFVFEKPTPAMIEPEDLAHALSNLCRFAGHVTKFYSVAQHLVLVSNHVPVEDALIGLLHDAAEAYLCDLPRYLKRAEGMEGYAHYTRLADAAIGKRFRVKIDPEPNSVKEADHRVLMTERRDLRPTLPILECLKELSKTYEPFPNEIIPWSPERAELEFKYRLGELWQER